MPNDVVTLGKALHPTCLRGNVPLGNSNILGIPVIGRQQVDWHVGGEVLRLDSNVGNWMCRPTCYFYLGFTSLHLHLCILLMLLSKATSKRELYKRA